MNFSIDGESPMCEDCKWWRLEDHESLDGSLTQEEIDETIALGKRPSLEMESTRGVCCLNPIRVVTTGWHFCSYFKYEPDYYGPWCASKKGKECKGCPDEIHRGLGIAQGEKRKKG